LGIIVIHYREKNGNSLCGLHLFSQSTRRLRDATCPLCLITNKAEKLRLDLARQYEKNFSNGKIIKIENNKHVELFGYVQRIGEYNRRRTVLIAPVFNFQNFNFVSCHMWIKGEEGREYKKFQKISAKGIINEYEKSNGERSFGLMI
jgi:hypothetical protein